MYIETLSCIAGHVICAYSQFREGIFIRKLNRVLEDHHIPMTVLSGTQTGNTVSVEILCMVEEYLKKETPEDKNAVRTFLNLIPEKDIEHIIVQSLFEQYPRVAFMLPVVKYDQDRLSITVKSADISN